MPNAVGLQLLGEVRLRSATATIDESRLGGRRGAVLLARLALADGASVHRSDLAEVLWGETRPDTWAASLRNVIVDVRRALSAAGVAGSSLAATQTGYVLAVDDGVDVDVQAVLAAAEDAHRHLSAGRADEACAAVRRVQHAFALDLLPGVTTAWVTSLRTLLEQAGVRALLVGAHAALRVGDATTAEAWARQVLERQPLREDAHRLLMEALACGGNRGEALAAYETCRSVLAEHLGVTPAPATQQIFATLLAEADELSPILLPKRDPSIGNLLLRHEATPFVGRAAELRVLAAAFRASRSAGPRHVEVTGESGVGKTRVAAELTARILAESGRVIYARTDDRNDVRHGPVLEIVDSLLHAMGRDDREAVLGRHAQALARLLPSVRDICPPPAASADAPAARPSDPAVVQAVRHVLHTVATAPGVDGLTIVLDDVHLAHQGDLRHVIDTLCDTDGHVPLCVVTVRQGGPDPRIVPGDVVTIEPLDLRTWRELALRRFGLGADADESVVDAWRNSGGNPLYAIELIASGVSLGSRPAGDDPRAFPERMLRVVRRRVEMLPPPARRLVRIAAVAGTSFGRDAVAAVSTDYAVDHPDDVLDELTREGMIRSVGGTRMTFRHTIVRECVLHEMPPASRVALDRQLQVAHEATSAREHDQAGTQDQFPARQVSRVPSLGAVVSERRAMHPVSLA